MEQMSNGPRPVYMTEANKIGSTKSKGWRKIAFMGIVMLCLIGMGVPMVVNLAVSGAITWALYPILANAYAIAVCTPLLAKRNSAALWLASASAFTLPFLYFLDILTPGREWFMGLALPIYAINVIAVWICFFIAKRAKNKWLGSALIVFISCVIISPVVNLLVLNFIRQFAAVSAMGTWLDIAITVTVGIVVAAVLLIVGFSKRRVCHEMPKLQ